MARKGECYPPHTIFLQRHIHNVRVYSKSFVRQHVQSISETDRILDSI